MLISLFSQNRSTSGNDVDTAAHFTNVFNENIVIPRNAKIGVVSLSVDLNGNVVISGTNNTFTIFLGSASVVATIPSGTYKLQSKTAGTTPTTTYPLMDAMQTALNTAISSASMQDMWPPSDNIIQGIKLDNGIGCQIDLKPTDTATSTGKDITTATSKTTGISQAMTEYQNGVQVESFTSGSNITFGDDTNGDYPLDANGEKEAGTGAAIERFGRATWTLSAKTGESYYCGMYVGIGPNGTPKHFMGFEVKTDNTIVIKETDDKGVDKFTPVDTSMTAGDGKKLRMEIPATTTTGDRFFRYFISEDGTEANFKSINLTSVSSNRRKLNANAKPKIATLFNDGMKSRPNNDSLTFSNGQWTITSAGSGLSAGVVAMQSTTSTHGVITSGAVNLLVSGGAVNDFNMTGGTLPNFSSTGDFTTGDTITFANGVVITKSATALTTDRSQPSVKMMNATYVVNPTRDPLLPHLEPQIIFNAGLSALLDIPAKLTGSRDDGTLHQTSRSPINIDSHQPEIYISSPSLPINSRTNKISHNTLARVPVGSSDNVGSQAGFHFHEVFNIVYHQLNNAQTSTLNQIEVRLTDREGSNLTQLLHPSTLTLHISTSST